VYLILLGPPGTGKGTQAKLVAEKLGLAHISSGDMLRDAVQRGTDLGRQAKAYMDKGELVPDELTIAMIEERLGQPHAQAGALFDGFPRTMQQAKALDQALARQGKAATAALHIAARDDEILRRLTGRWLCPSCGAIYHEHSLPPKASGVCDQCGGTLTQRDDDRPDVARARLERQRPAEELLHHYREQGKLVDINGEQDVDAVTHDLMAAIEQTPAAPERR